MVSPGCWKVLAIVHHPFEARTTMLRVVLGVISRLMKLICRSSSASHAELHAAIREGDARDTAAT